MIVKKNGSLNKRECHSDLNAKKINGEVQVNIYSHKLYRLLYTAYESYVYIK